MKSIKEQFEKFFNMNSDNSMVRLTVGEKIQRCREFLGLTQAELADMSGLSRHTIVNYELYDAEFKRGFKYKNLNKIIVAFVSVAERIGFLDFIA